MAKLNPEANQTIAMHITAHPGFAPLIAVWFASFLGLGVIVLPGVHISRLAMITELTALGDFARPVLALVLAIVGGLVGFGCAKAIQRFSKTSPATRFAHESTAPVRPIDPELELGSVSLDAPLEDEIFQEWPDCPDSEWEQDWDTPSVMGSLDNSKDEISDSKADREPTTGAASAALDDNDATIDLAWFEDEPNTAPQALELSDFANLSNAETLRHELDQEVNDSRTGDSTKPGLAPQALSAALKSGRSVEALRQTPTSDLSLIQMVERFAAALHDHQDRARNSGAVERDAALIEGLRALSELAGNNSQSSRSHNPITSEHRAKRLELRQALEKLRNLSDVA